MSLAEKKTKADLAALRIQRRQEFDPGSSSRSRLLKNLIIAIVVVVVAATAYRTIIAPSRAPQVEITTAKATIVSATPTLLTATGYLVADRSANVSSKLSGKVTQLNFDVGSEVKGGDLLAVLESSELQAQLDEAQAAYSDAQREYNRQKNMYDEGVTSKALLDNAEAQLKVTRARVDRVRVNLSDMVIRAPFAGTVVTKNAELGEMVSPMTMGGSSALGAAGSIATIADLRTIEVEVDVNESNVGQLRVGQAAEITVDAFPNQKWRGRLRQIVPTANRAKGVVQVKVAFLNPSPGLLPEMSASVAFLPEARSDAELAEKPKIWLATSAVVDDGSGRHVFVEKESRVEKRTVTVGESREGRLEIASGVSEGDRVVLQPKGLKDGDRVKIAK